jgi:hypothetical protein
MECLSEALIIMEPPSVCLIVGFDEKLESIITKTKEHNKTFSAQAQGKGCPKG